MAGQLGYGIEIRAGATAAATTATVLLGACTDIPVPPLTRAEVEVTAHDSPGGVREFIPGLKEVGAIDIALNWIPGNATHDHVRLMQDVAMGVQADFLFEVRYAQMSGTPTCTFRAFVTNFVPTGQVDGALTGTLSLRPVSVPVWAGV